MPANIKRAQMPPRGVGAALRGHAPDSASLRVRRPGPAARRNTAATPPCPSMAGRRRRGRPVCVLGMGGGADEIVGVVGAGRATLAWLERQAAPPLPRPPLRPAVRGLRGGREQVHVRGPLGVPVAPKNSGVAALVGYGRVLDTVVGGPRPCGGQRARLGLAAGVAGASFLVKVWHLGRCARAGRPAIAPRRAFGLSRVDRRPKPSTGRPGARPRPPVLAK